MIESTYISGITKHDAHSDSMVDLVHLHNGMLLAVTDEAVACFSDRSYQLGLNPEWTVTDYTSDGFTFSSDQAMEDEPTTKQYEACSNGADTDNYLAQLKAKSESHACSDPVTYDLQSTHGCILVVVPVDELNFQINRYFQKNNSWHVTIEQEIGDACLTLSTLAALMSAEHIAHDRLSAR